MVVAVIAMRVMETAVHQVIHVVAMWNWLMATGGTMLVT